MRFLGSGSMPIQAGPLRYNSRGGPFGRGWGSQCRCRKTFGRCSGNCIKLSVTQCPLTHLQSSLTQSGASAERSILVLKVSRPGIMAALCWDAATPSDPPQRACLPLPLPFDPAAYLLTISGSLKMGRNMQMTMPPTTTPRKTIRIGSIRAVNPESVVSISSSRKSAMRSSILSILPVCSPAVTMRMIMIGKTGCLPKAAEMLSPRSMSSAAVFIAFSMTMLPTV